MTRTYQTLLALVVVTACGGSSTGPSTSALTVKATDPSGDTYGALDTQWDLTGLTITRDTGGIDFTIELTTNAVSPMSGDSNAVVGEIDFDTDQSITTGTTSFMANLRLVAAALGSIPSDGSITARGIGDSGGGGTGAGRTPWLIPQTYDQTTIKSIFPTSYT